MTRIQRTFVLAVAVAVAPAVAGSLRIVRRPEPLSAGQREQAKRLVPAMTGTQKDAPPFSRFRFRPTRADLDRIGRLRAGEVDTVRVLCLRVEFAEDTTPLTTGNGRMDTLGFFAPESGLFYDPPHFKRYFERQLEGVRNYIRAMSLGRLWVEYTVMPEPEKECYQLPREMQFYGDTVSYEGIEFGLVRLLRDAIKVADEDPAVRFADYDEFIVFHAGSGLQSDYAADGRSDSPFDLLAGEIPPGALEAYLGQPYILVDSGRTRIEQGTVLPEMMRQDTLTADGRTNILGMVGLAGTLTHEFCHLLGAYDLYDVTGVTMGVGGWSLMGYGGWLGDYGAGAPPGVIPGFLDAYSRMLLGFVNPLTISSPVDSVAVYAAAMDTALFALRPDSTHPTILQIPVNRSEYFLVENRQTDVRKPDTIVVDTEDGVLIAVEDNEYDFFQPGSGLLVWHVDEGIIGDYGPFNAINIFPEHKGVDMEEGDGIQDFDVPYWESFRPDYEIYGYRFDPFSKQGYNDRFTAETNPNTDGYTGKTFLSLEVLGGRDTLDRLKDTVIAVRVAWDLYQPGFPADPGRGSRFLSAFAADLDEDGMLEVVVADSGGQVSAWRSDGRGYRFPNGAFVNLGRTTSSDVAIGDVTASPGLEVVAAADDGRVRLFSSAGASLAVMVTGDRIVAAPVLADLDGDGFKDIVVGSTDMKLYAWNGQGELLPGFPVEVGSEIRAAVAVSDTVRPRIFVLAGDSRLFLLNCDGSVVPGFPKVLGPSPFYALAQPVVADFDRDGELEAAVAAGGGHDYRLYLVGQDGEVKFVSEEKVGHPFAGQLSVADVDGDGYLDVLLASRYELFAFNWNMTPLDGFPLREDSTYRKTELAGNWIVTYDAPFQYSSSPIPVDLDSDGSPEFVIGSPVNGVLGSALPGRQSPRLFPLMTTASVSGVPLVADLDADGRLEIAVGAGDGVFHVWKVAGSSGRPFWPCAFRDASHTGLVRQSELPELPPSTSGAVTGFFVYPNPAGERVAVRYRLGPGSPAEVKIRVLDMAGDPVTKELAGSALPGAVNETPLDLTKLAPGLYVVRLQVTVSGVSTVRFARLAVVR